MCSETVGGGNTLWILFSAALLQYYWPLDHGVLGLHELQVTINIDFHHLEELCGLWPSYLDCAWQL